MTKTKKAGQTPRSLEPPRVFVMDRDVESQISNDNLQMSESGDFIPPPPPLYRVLRKKSPPTPSAPPPQELDNIDKPTNEVMNIPLQQKTSVMSIPNDLENALKSHPDFELGEHYGIYDDQFDGGKTRKHSKVRRYGKKTRSKRRVKSKRRMRKNKSIKK